MKARKVKGLDPGAPLAGSARRIVAVRLDELCGFWPLVSDPSEVAALHDMRIAAKRLRYVLEVTHPCFGPGAEAAIGVVKDLQDLLGEIHDCDEQVPEVVGFLTARMAVDAEAVAAGANGSVGPGDLAHAPHRAEYAGLVALLVTLQARRSHLFGTFLTTWRELERDGFRARLEHALAEAS